MTAVGTATEIRPFQVEVPDEKIDDLRRRIAETRWPTKELAQDRAQGVQLAMPAAWANFAAAGDPSSAAVPWPSFDDGARVLSLVQPQPRVETNFASIHHCAFWGVG